MSNYPPKQLPHDPSKKNIVVLGSGWAGLSFIEELDNENYNVTVVSPKDYFVYTPLLPSYMVGDVSLASLLVKIKTILAYKKREVRYIKAYCTDVSPKTKTISIQAVDDDSKLINNAKMPYDYLVIATGTIPGYAGIIGLEENSIPMRDPIHSRMIKEKLDSHLNLASIRNMPQEEISRLLGVVLIGAGPTGVELASVINNYLNSEIAMWYPHLAGKSKVTLIDYASRILPTLNQSCSEYASKYLKSKKIEILTDAKVKAATANNVVLARDDDTNMKIPAGVIISAIGEAPNSLVKKIVEHIDEPSVYSPYVFPHVPP